MKKCHVCNSELELLVIDKRNTKVYWCDTCKKAYEETANTPTKEE